MQTESGIPPVIPIEKLKAVREALGITAKGVYRIEIEVGIDRVLVHRFAKDEAGRTVLVGDQWGPHGAQLVRFVDAIPLSRTDEGVQD